MCRCCRLHCQAKKREVWSLIAKIHPAYGGIIGVTLHRVTLFTLLRARDCFALWGQLVYSGSISHVLPALYGEVS